MSGVLGRCFFRRCYQLFGEALDILALLNGAINFILYCAMSRQYRQTFRQLFSPAWRLALGPWCRRKGVQCAKRRSNGSAVRTDLQNRLKRKL
ncbi:Sex peptide receptor-related protein 2 [Frankliniella fusca]|uniref:Sex peptide receptor-related protein 2 n=1 Tax=Frankliniella fusca TaxID=407009 RepID=A0AAE1HYK0_9NEOP|nr:Sex peptide receptor-related protein 2 [Frankliniella fusca]